MSGFGDFCIRFSQTLARFVLCGDLVSGDAIFYLATEARLRRVSRRWSLVSRRLSRFRRGKIAYSVWGEFVEKWLDFCGNGGIVVYTFIDSSKRRSIGSQIVRRNNMGPLRSKSASIGRVIFLVVLVCLISRLGYGAPWAGSGTGGDPYQIWTAEDMQAIGADANYWDACFKLMADIDLGAYTCLLYTSPSPRDRS